MVDTLLALPSILRNLSLFIVSDQCQYYQSVLSIYSRIDKITKVVALSAVDLQKAVPPSFNIYVKDYVDVSLRFVYGAERIGGQLIYENFIIIAFDFLTNILSSLRAGDENASILLSPTTVEVLTRNITNKLLPLTLSELEMWEENPEQFYKSEEDQYSGKYMV